MPSDEEIIMGLIEGITAQSGDVSQEVRTGKTTGMEVKGDRHSLSNIAVTDTGDEVELYIAPPSIRETSVQHLAELQGLIQNPGTNEDKIMDIYTWFSEKVPFIASVLSICDFAAGINLPG